MQKGAHDTGQVVQKAAHDTGKAVAKATHDTGAAINKANNDFHGEEGRTWEHVNHFLNEGDKFFCSFFTAGQSDLGNAKCSVSGGVGASADGSAPQPYTFDPANPEQHYPVGAPELTLPSAAELAGMNHVLGPPPDMQDWERREDAFLQLFLNPGDRIGLPWVGASSETRFPNGTWEVRQSGGGFLDRRHDERYPGGYRYHGGIDYLNHAGDVVLSPITGTVTRVFPPSEPGMLGIQITTDRGYTTQVLYVQPSEAISGALAKDEHPTVAAGSPIGQAQDIHMRIDDHGTGRPAYPGNVPQHVHVTMKDPDGRFVSPDGKTVIVMRRGQAPVVTTSVTRTISAPSYCLIAFLPVVATHRGRKLQ